MKKMYFVTERQFDEWNEGGNHYITAVFDNRDFVCDVEQKDFLYLQDIGFLDCAGNIIPVLDIEQTEMFKDSWGVEIVYYGGIYDEICNVLTWYEHSEQSPLRNVYEFNDAMYNLLSKVKRLFNR